MKKILVASSVGLLLSAVNPVQAQKKLAEYLPERVQMILTLNPLRIGQKVPVETLRQNFLFKKLTADPESPVNKIFSNLSSTGINLAEDIYLVMSSDSSGRKITHLMVKLAAPEKFRSTILEAGIPAEKINVYGTDHVLIKGDNILAWNRDIAVFATLKDHHDYDMVDVTMDTVTQEFVPPVMKRPEGAGKEEDEEESVEVLDTTVIEDVDVLPPPPPPPPMPPGKIIMEEVTEEEEEEFIEEAKAKELRDLAFELLTPRPGNALRNDPRFISMISEPGDIRIWQNTKDEFFSSPLIPQHFFLTRFSKFMGEVKSATVSFEPGKILVSGRDYYGEEMSAMLQKASQGTPGEDLIKQIPQGELIALVSSSYHMTLVRELIKKPLFMELADSVMKYGSIDIRKLPSVFGNNVMAAVTQTQKTKSPFELVVAIPIADKDAFESMEGHVKKLYDSLKNSENALFRKGDPVIKHNGKMMVLSTTEAAADNFMEKKKTQPFPPELTAYTQHPMMIYLDLQQLMSLAMSSARSTGAMEEGQKLLGTFDDMIIYGGEFMNGAVQSNIEIRFQDKSKNSLVQVMEFFGNVGDLMLRNHDMEPEEWESVDTMEILIDTSEIDMPVSVEVPRFSDPEVQAFVDEYTQFLEVLLASKGDSTATREYTEKMTKWSEKTQSIGVKLAENKEDLEKWNDWWQQVAKRLAIEGTRD